MVLQYNSEILGKSISAVPHGPVHSSVFTTLGNSQGTYPTNSVVPDTGVTGARCPGCDNICCRLLGDKAACAVPLMKQTASSIFLIFSNRCGRLVSPPRNIPGLSGGWVSGRRICFAIHWNPASGLLHTNQKHTLVNLLRTHTLWIDRR